MEMRSVLAEKFGIANQDIDKAEAAINSVGGRLERLLVSLGTIEEEDLADIYSEFLSLPKLSREDIESVTFHEVPSEHAEFLIEHNAYICALEKHPEKYAFVLFDPFEHELLQFRHHFYPQSEIFIATKKTVEELIQTQSLFGQTQDSELSISDNELERLKDMANEAPTVNFVNSLIANGLKKRASDLHIEPIDSRVFARFRIDGVLQPGEAIPLGLSKAVISRLKLLAGMDIAEKRRPQDGKIEMRIASKDLDLRVSCLPLGEGESLVMRFLLKESIGYELERLGLSDDVRHAAEADIRKTTGVILLTGPTGSGKTTTLYSFINQINSPEVKIITLEDPIEYQLRGVNQVQVHSDIGFDFAAGLRSIVRQDPDIIMLGEIRDSETANIAMQSALTGHLVFSTVHTNDAPTAFIRLADLGVDEFLLNSALTSVIAQRLVRKLCPHCSEQHEEPHAIVSKYKLEHLFPDVVEGSLNIRKAGGCEACNFNGYLGRESITEYLPNDDYIRSLPKDSQFVDSAVKHIRGLGFRTLFEDGLLKVCNGRTTIEEVLRVAG